MRIPILASGDVIRCIALSQAWHERGGRSIFITVGLTPTLQVMLENEGISVHLLDVQPGSNFDAEKLIEFSDIFKPSWIVIDGYQFSSKYHNLIKSSGHFIMVIDDYGHLDAYNSDLILNQNIHANKGMYKNKITNSQLLLGPKYSLLRAEFRKTFFKQRVIPDRATRLLVTMGGADKPNATLQVINAIKLIQQKDITSKIIVGQSNTHRNTLENSILNNETTFELLYNISNIYQLMRWADASHICRWNNLS